MVSDWEGYRTDRTFFDLSDSLAKVLGLEPLSTGISRNAVPFFSQDEEFSSSHQEIFLLFAGKK